MNSLNEDELVLHDYTEMPRWLGIEDIRQLKRYILNREEIGWYYGDKTIFEERHQKLRNWIEEILEVYYAKPAIFDLT